MLIRHQAVGFPFGDELLLRSGVVVGCEFVEGCQLLRCQQRRDVPHDVLLMIRHELFPFPHGPECVGVVRDDFGEFSANEFAEAEVLPAAPRASLAASTVGWWVRSCSNANSRRRISASLAMFCCSCSVMAVSCEATAGVARWSCSCTEAMCRACAVFSRH